MQAEKFDLWCVVELFGHSQIAGKCTEQNIAGTNMLRVDVPETDSHPPFTKLYGASAIYAINPVDEQTARAKAAQLNVAPIQVYNLKSYLDKQQAALRVVSNLHKIKHWKIQLSDYRDIPNRPATWFIDFPYFNGGHKYPMSNRKIDFIHAGDWCQDREGQVIVCENSSATWLPFVPLKQTIGVAKKTQEVIWTNYHTHFNNVQQKLEL